MTAEDPNLFYGSPENQKIIRQFLKLQSVKDKGNYAERLVEELYKENDC